MSGLLVRIDGRDLVVGEHTIARYHERVRPVLGDVDQVAEELRRVLPLGRVTKDPPAWVTGEPADAWVILDDAIAFPIKGRTIVTCKTRSEYGEQLREQRQQKRQERDRRRNAPGRATKHGKVARQERRRARERREQAG